MEYFKNEKKIFAMGGKIKNDYETFRTSILYLNANQIPLFICLGFNSGEDTDVIIDAICGLGKSAQTLYIERMTELVKKGVIPKNSLIGKATLKEREGETPEQREKRCNNQIHRNLIFRFKDIYGAYVDTYKPCLIPPNLYPIRILRETLEMTEKGLVINVDKYIEIYTDFVEADNSITKQHHKEAAEALNRFFNGVPITEKELNTYFFFKNGIAEIRAESVNKTSYARLGVRTPKIIVNEKEPERE